jgi:hypothetical protein
LYTQDWLEFLMAEQIVRLLYEHGADPDAADTVLGRTPRAFAQAEGLKDVLVRRSCSCCTCT